jgi:hypothetical protein
MDCVVAACPCRNGQQNIVDGPQRDLIRFRIDLCSLILGERRHKALISLMNLPDAYELLVSTLVFCIDDYVDSKRRSLIGAIPARPAR